MAVCKSGFSQIPANRHQHHHRHGGVIEVDGGLNGKAAVKKHALQNEKKHQQNGWRPPFAPGFYKKVN
jgi:hypothetical protein